MTDRTRPANDIKGPQKGFSNLFRVSQLRLVSNHKASVLHMHRRPVVLMSPYKRCQYTRISFCVNNITRDDLLSLQNWCPIRFVYIHLNNKTGSSQTINILIHYMKYINSGTGILVASCRILFKQDKKESLHFLKYFKCS